MVKLSKQQLSAVADKIFNDLQEKTREVNSLIEKEKNEFIARKIARYPILQGFENAGYNSNAPLKIIEHKFKDELAAINKKSKINPRKSSIEQDIILATIDNDSLEEIIATIVAKYQ